MNIKLTAIAAMLLAIGAATCHAQQTANGTWVPNYESAKELYANKHYGAAAIALAEALEHETEAEEIEQMRFMLMSSHFRLGTLELEEIDRYMSDYPGNSHKNVLAFMAGYICFSNGDYEEATSRLGKCDVFALQDSDCEEAIYAMAVSCLKTGRMQGAKVNFSALKTSSEKYREDAAFNLGYIHYEEGNYPAARAELTPLSNSPRFGIRSTTYLADIDLKTGNLDKALAVADRLLGTGNDTGCRAALLRIKGTVHYKQGNMSEAAKALDMYREATPPKERDREAMYMLGMACFAVKAYMKSREALYETINSDDALAQNAWLHIGLASLELADRDRARMAFERASATNHDGEVTAQALYNYGMCINETSYSPFNESVKVFEKLINNYPGSRYRELASDRLADAYLASSDYKAALESINKLSNPGRSILAAKQIILYKMGLLHFANADYAKAEETFTAALALGNLDKEARDKAHFWRGEARYRTGNLQGAGSDFNLYAKYAPEGDAQTLAMSYYNLGYVNFKQGSYANALANFRKANSMAGNLPNNVAADMANRMGDCYYRQRDFGNAHSCYARAKELDFSQGDYSTFQRAFIKGLEKDYIGKAELLGQLLSQYPDSPLRDDALYEKGRAYVMMDNEAEAITTYETLMATCPASPYTRRAEAERAMLLHKGKKYREAADAYKAVITKYPGTDEAGQASRDLQSLYVETNTIDEYFKFANSMGLDNDATKRDSLTYAAAERLYMSKNKEEGTKALEKYLSEFPNGIYATNAGYYAGLAYYERKDYEKALQHLGRVTANAPGRFTEDALMMVASIHYDADDYENAEQAYRKLREAATNDETAIYADAGVMRCCIKAGKMEQAERAATALLERAKADPQLIIEARRARARARTALAKYQEALDDWKAIAGNTSIEAGAEARFRTAEITFELGGKEEAEKIALEFINEGTPHAYWMARCFILLADIYASEGRYVDARQYLISLKQNYQGKEDIAEMIEERLANLKDK